MAVVASAREVQALDLSRPSQSLWADAVNRLLRNKAAVAGLVVIALFVLVALLASVLAPHNPLKIYDGMGYLPPAWVERSLSGQAGDPRFLLGTDTIGRDVLSRVLYGARVSMVVTVPVERSARKSLPVQPYSLSISISSSHITFLEAAGRCPIGQASRKVCNLVARVAAAV